jgi:AcrR family transcriptional regulator
MSMSEKKRSYNSRQRADAAAHSRSRVIEAARTLFAGRGFEAVTIADIAEKAGVSASGIYANFKSKEGVLHALMEQALFGSRYRAALAHLAEETDPVKQVISTAKIARAVYEGESEEIGLIRGVSALSPALKALEQSFENLRFELQAARVENLFAAGAVREGLSIEEARRVLWMYSSREIYRLLVQEGGWTPDRYEAWLSQTLADALVKRTEA